MTDKKPYTYTVLRYVHDVATAEFVNVGVVIHCPKQRYLGAKLRRTHGRLSDVFPDLDPAAFRSAMSAIDRALRAAGEAYKKDDLLRWDANAASLARSVLPADDSSLQWSPVGSGLTSNAELQLEHLFVRLVGRYDATQEHRRTDADVWRPIRERLDQANLTSKLTEKVIRSTADTLEFKHTRKNGVWHCYEALSFDLANADGIKNKARRWTGHLVSVSDATDIFKPYFIVGAPTDLNLQSAYQEALAILKKSPVEIEIFAESDVDTLVARIEAEIAAHD